MKNHAFLFLFLAAFTSAADGLPDDPISLAGLSQQGNHNAMTKLGYLYFTGQQVEKSVEKALSLYKRAARKGNLWAMSNLCNMYLYGEGVEKDLKKALDLCIEPARSGNPNAMVMTAEIVLQLEKGPFAEDKQLAGEMAFELYEMAATLEHVHAQYMLGQFYEHGFLGAPINSDLAQSWYRRAASNGHQGAAQAVRELAESHNKSLNDGAAGGAN